MVAISELIPFTLSDFGLYACRPTLKFEDYSPPSKDWLLGGWLNLPRWASHPLDFTTLLGRIRSSASPFMSPERTPGIVREVTFSTTRSTTHCPKGLTPRMNWTASFPFSVLSAASNVNLKEKTESVLKTLTPREAQVLKMRFGLGDGSERTLEEVSWRFSVTRELSDLA